MSSQQIYSYILENKKKLDLFKKILNNVYKLDNKYVIKIINNLNNNLFVSLGNYYFIKTKTKLNIFLFKRHFFNSHLFIRCHIVKILFFWIIFMFTILNQSMIIMMIYLGWIYVIHNLN